MEKTIAVLEELAPEWKQALEDASDEEVKVKVSVVALNEQDNQNLKDADEDLASAKEAVKVASEQYVSATKVNKAKIKYAKYLLESRGKQ